MTQSVAFHQFPQIVWRDGEKHLWNPIHRQAYKNRPEERVRLCIVEYLLAGGWSKHRISTEEAVDLPRREAKLRTDLICYTKDFTPFLLVECKAENITLSGQTADQIARYNQRVDAPYLLMTNGRTDFWHHLSNKHSVELLDAIPDSLPQISPHPSDFEYWKKRGFSGSNATPELRLWLNSALKAAYIDTNVETASPPIRHLSFKKRPSNVPLSNYYHIHSNFNIRLALGFTATEFGGNRLIGIFNRAGKNEAVLEINLDLLFDDRAPNASLYWSGATKTVDIRKHISSLSSTDFKLTEAASYLSSLIHQIIR